MTELKIESIFNLPYFPDGNAIEYIFSKVKSKFKRQILVQIMCDSKQPMSQIVQKSFEGIPKS